MSTVRQAARVGPLLALVLALLGPRPARADRGALTLEIGPALTVVRSVPSIGSSSEITGTMGGGLLGARYDLLGGLEVSATAFWEAPAAFYHSNARVLDAGQALEGTLGETSSRYGFLAGARLVRGFIWRYHVGVEVGWARQTFSKRHLVYFPNPGSPTTYDQSFAGSERDAFVIAPLAGVEWQVGDHWSIAAIPRLEILMGGVGRLAFVLPLSVGYSWFHL